MGFFSGEYTTDYEGHEITLYLGYNTGDCSSYCIKLYIDGKCLDEKVVPSWSMTKHYTVRGSLLLDNGKDVLVKGHYIMKFFGRNIFQIEVENRILLEKKGTIF